MKKVCVITGARSEYGLLRWVIEGIDKDPTLKLQLVVTGGHLSPEQGLTYQAIEEDGYHIDEKVEMLLSSETAVGIGKSMGVCALGMTDAFNRLNPDMVVVLGDRYELLPIVGTALVMRIPIAHISGGDVTEGAIDDEIRNAVTMMASLHFPGVVDSAQRIERMRGSADNVYPVGEPGLDSFYRIDLMDKRQLAENLHIDETKKWVLVTFHAETTLSTEENLTMVRNFCRIMDTYKDVQFVITKANADLGGNRINQCWKEYVAANEGHALLLSSLGQLRYLSFMKYCDAVVGNSSSGIVEAPFIGTPVLNVGNRQKGRRICRNVVCCASTYEDMSSRMKVVMTNNRIIDTYWGDGHTSEKIVQRIKSFLAGRNE